MSLIKLSNAVKAIHERAEVHLKGQEGDLWVISVCVSDAHLFDTKKGDLQSVLIEAENTLAKLSQRLLQAVKVPDISNEDK